MQQLFSRVLTYGTICRRSLFYATSSAKHTWNGAAFQIRRFCSLSDYDFEKYSEQTLQSLSEQLEHVIDQLPPDVSCKFDVSYSQGVLTFEMGDIGTYVLNKQGPNRQIWLSSPFSGPKRYDLVDHKWIYSRDSVSLDELLNAELLASVPQLKGIDVLKINDV